MRTPSRVMRMQKKNEFSQTSLPEVQQNQIPKMNLASLSGSYSARTREVDADMATKNKDLADLLLKLDGNSETLPRVSRSQRDTSASRQNTDSLVSLTSLSEESISMANTPRVAPSRTRSLNQPAVAERDASTAAMDSSFDIDLDIDDDRTSDNSIADDSLNSMPSLSLDENFFDPDEEALDNSGESESIPTASGSFARTPSGGFKLALESIRSTCSDIVSRIRGSLAGVRGKTRIKSSRRGNVSRRRSETVTMAKAEKRRKLLAIGLVAIGLVALLVFAFANINSSKQQTPDTTNSIATNENSDFELIALEGDSSADDVPTFDADAFDADAFKFADDTDSEMPAAAAARPSAVPAEAILAAQAEAAKALQTAAPAASSQKSAKTQAGPTEIRKYGRNDNLVISPTPETFKLTRSCVMREGPASRFPLVAEIKPGQKVEILTTTDEDWLFSNGVWTKAGQANRLGPGTQFAEAAKGMTVAAPTSRVISAKNWKYIKVGKNYGYVGPACFK